MRALGVDLGGTKALGCLVDEAGDIVARTTRPTGRATGPIAALRLLASLANELGRAPGGFGAVGIGFPGLVDAERGVARSSVMLEGWDGVPLREGVAEMLGVPCFVDNDVNTAAVAELDARRGGPPGAMVFVAVGTGIGGAITIDGKLWRGVSGTAGEIGNMTIARDGLACWCGRRGCLNTLASGSAIERSLGRVPGSLSARIDSADARVGAAIREAAQALGAGLANVVNLLNPSLVVLGGGVCRLEGFVEEVERAARAEAFAEAGEGCAFEAARAGYEAGAVGAALLARSLGSRPACLAGSRPNEAGGRLSTSPA